MGINEGTAKHLQTQGASYGHHEEDSTKEAQPATAGTGVGQRQQGLSTNGLFPVATLGDRSQLPGLWRRRSERSVSRCPRALSQLRPGGRRHRDTGPLPTSANAWLPAGGAGSVAQGLQVNAGGVSGVWSRHSQHQRLIRLRRSNRGLANPTAYQVKESIIARPKTFSPRC